MRRWLILLVVLLTQCYSALAQDTPSPTPSPTPTLTYTPSPTLSPTPTPSPTWTATVTFTPSPIPTFDPRGKLPPGAVQPYVGNSAPPGWLICDGSAVSRTTYSWLFAAIGTTFGAGDGSITFNLPDLRGRTVVGSGAGPGLTSRSLATPFGEENHQQTVQEMPSHNHGSISGTPAKSNFITGNGVAINVQSGTGITLAGMQLNSSGGSTGNTGAGLPFNVIQPSLALNYIIWTGVQLETNTPVPTNTATPTATFTYTPSNTPTPTITPTASSTIVGGVEVAPNWVVESTVEVNGTPQAVAVSYSVSAGEFTISFLLMLVVALLVVSMVLQLRRK